MAGAMTAGRITPHFCTFRPFREEGHAAHGNCDGLNLHMVLP